MENHPFYNNLNRKIKIGIYTSKLVFLYVICICICVLSRSKDSGDYREVVNVRVSIGARQGLKKEVPS